MKILVLNCGSTSIKFKLFEIEQKKMLSQGIVDRIKRADSNITIENSKGTKMSFPAETKDYETAIKQILQLLVDETCGCLKSLDEIDAVGHRVAHGGEKYKESVIVTDEVIVGVRENIDLAPLHNPANIAGIKAARSLLGNVEQVVVFDTSFHQSIPKYAYVYPLPYELYEENGIRRYGFHGTSYRYVSARACELLGVNYDEQRMIVCHLGGGMSVSAINKGKSVDVSLGMTALGGVMMATRCGDIDPGLIPYIMDKKHMNIDEVSNLMYNNSGLLGLSGVSSDMRDIEVAAKEGNERAQLAMDILGYQLKKQVGAFTAVLGGLDILIFTGGVGENHVYTRECVCKNMEYMGLELDEKKNETIFGKEATISTEYSKVKVLVIPTNEELMIALDTADLVGGK